jgi:hypothetical protein
MTNDQNWRSKLKALVDVEILDGDIRAFEDLVAVSYYLELPEGLVCEAEIKRLVAHHLRQAQAPAEWISLTEFSP